MNNDGLKQQEISPPVASQRLESLEEFAKRDTTEQVKFLYQETKENLKKNEKLQGEMEKHRELLILGFMVLLVMVAGLILDVMLSFKDKSSAPEVIYEFRQ